MQIVDWGENGLVLGRRSGDAHSRRDGARRREVLHRYAEIEADWPHAWPRMVRAHFGSIRNAAYPGQGVEVENTGGTRID